MNPVSGRVVPADDDPDRRRARTFFWCVLAVAAAVSIVGNGAQALLHSSIVPAIAAAVAIIPPLALLAAVHGVTVLARVTGGRRTARRSTTALTVVIAGAAFWMSFTSLRGLAVTAGVPAAEAWLWPLIVEGSMTQSTIALLTLAHHHRPSHSTGKHRPPTSPPEQPAFEPPPAPPPASTPHLPPLHPPIDKSPPVHTPDGPVRTLDTAAATVRTMNELIATVRTPGPVSRHRTPTSLTVRTETEVAGSAHAAPGTSTASSTALPVKNSRVPTPVGHSTSGPTVSSTVNQSESEPERVHTDLQALAERICRSDPRGRRSVATVTEILIRHRVHGHNASRIAREFGRSRSAVSRILRAADQLESHPQDKLMPSADDSSASTDRPADPSNAATNVSTTQ